MFKRHMMVMHGQQPQSQAEGGSLKQVSLGSESMWSYFAKNYQREYRSVSLTQLKAQLQQIVMSSFQVLEILTKDQQFSIKTK
mmetsp:Transcript_6418/g.10900  ORF Transcript_6418/g.10900 Transcript_6418/m.10900 type:complete len:83 (+) Transcript_6418:145-393(+)